MENKIEIDKELLKQALLAVLPEKKDIKGFYPTVDNIYMTDDISSCGFNACRQQLIDNVKEKLNINLEE